MSTVETRMATFASQRILLTFVDLVSRGRFFFPHLELASIPFDSLLKAQKQLAKSNAHASRKGKGKAKQVDEEPDDEGQDAPRKGKNGKGLNNKGGKSRGGSSIEGRSNKHA